MSNETSIKRTFIKVPVVPEFKNNHFVIICREDISHVEPYDKDTCCIYLKDENPAIVDIAMTVEDFWNTYMIEK